MTLEELEKAKRFANIRAEIGKQKKDILIKDYENRIGNVLSERERENYFKPITNNLVNLIREGMKPAPVQVKPEVSNNLPFQVSVGIPGADIKALEDAEKALDDLTNLFNSQQTDLDMVSDNILDNTEDIASTLTTYNKEMEDLIDLTKTLEELVNDAEEIDEEIKYLQERLKKTKKVNNINKINNQIITNKKDLDDILKQITQAEKEKETKEKDVDIANKNKMAAGKEGIRLQKEKERLEKAIEKSNYDLKLNKSNIEFLKKKVKPAEGTPPPPPPIAPSPPIGETPATIASPPGGSSVDLDAAYDPVPAAPETTTPPPPIAATPAAPAVAPETTGEPAAETTPAAPAVAPETSGEPAAPEPAPPTAPAPPAAPEPATGEPAAPAAPETTGETETETEADKIMKKYSDPIFQFSDDQKKIFNQGDNELNQILEKMLNVILYNPMTGTKTSEETQIKNKKLLSTNLPGFLDVYTDRIKTEKRLNFYKENETLKDNILTDEERFNVYNYLSALMITSGSSSSDISSASIIGTGMTMFNDKNNKVGVITIDKELLKKKVLSVRKKGRLQFQKKVDQDTVDLLMKPFNQKRNYSNEANQNFVKIIQMSELKFKYKDHPLNQHYQHECGSSIKIIKDVDEAVDRLELLMGTKKLGNTSTKVKNEGFQLVDYLKKNNKIDEDEHKALYQYFEN